MAWQCCELEGSADSRDGIAVSGKGGREPTLADLCFITPCKRSFVPSHTLSDLERTEETSEEKEGERAEDVLS
eukprot:2407026-Rhodomonas_salina.1